MKRLVSLFITLFVIVASFPSFAASKKEIVLVKLKDNQTSYFNIAAKNNPELKKQAIEDVSQEVCDTYGGEIRYSYSEAITGFSMLADKEDIQKIAECEYVESVIIVPCITANDPNDSVNVDNITCCEMINIPYAHEIGYKGEGKLVAIIDGSFDSDHAFFKEDVLNPKLDKEELQSIIESDGLNAYLSSESLYKSTKLPFVYNYCKRTADTKSSDIHGTHVAGIIGGKNGTKGDIELNGVAPESQLALMAVEDESGDIYVDTVLAAMEDCIKIGADAVNLSLGIPYGEMIDIFDEAVTNMKNAGIIVCAASGNDSRGYAKGQISPLNIDYAEYSSPASMHDVTSVANAIAPSSQMLVGIMTGGDKSFAFVNGDVSFSSEFKGKTIEFVYCGLGRKDDIPENINGKVALVKRGEITYNEKAQNVKEKGAVGLIVANSTDSLLNPDCKGVLPIAFVTRSIGEFLQNTEDKTIQIAEDEELKYESQAGYTISNTSGWATGMDLELKPDISAPGTKILSSTTGEEYQNQSGTSMATPHYAGAYVLVSQYIDSLGLMPSQALTENIIMSSARILRFTDTGVPYSPRNQGAGLVDVYSALNTKVVLKGNNGKSKLSLGENLTDEITIPFYAQNLTDEAVTFDEISVEVMTDSITEDGFVGDMKYIPFTADIPSQITIDANSEKEIQIKITLDSQKTKENLEIYKNGFFVDGYIIMKKSGTEQKSNIAFTGFYGDWERASAVDLPWYEQDSFYSVTGLYSAVGQECDTENHSCFPLGVNSFAVELMEQEEIDPMEYSGAEYAGYSPNDDGILDELCVMTFALRPCYDFTLTVTDKDGNIKYTNTEEVKEKYILSCKDIDNAFDEGDYTVNVSAVYASDKKTEYELNMPFYIDKTSPVINKITISENDGKKLLKINAQDNRYIMGMEIIKNGTVISKQAIKPSDKAEAVFDITGLAENEITIRVTDYAFNTFSGRLKGLECNIEKPVVFTDENAVVFAEFVNITGQEITADIFAVLYGQDGNMKDVNYKPNEKISVLSSTKFFELKNVSSGDIIKVITLEKGNVKPLCKYAQIKATR